MLVVLFVLGFFVGVFGCLFILLAAFFHAQSRLDALILRKTLKHAKYSAVAKEAAKLLPVKVESLCKLASFDDDVTGTVVRCRVVLYSNTAYFYRIDHLDERADHRKVVAKEQLIGSVNAACVVASSQHISKYHRHRNKNSRFSALRGKCLVLSARDGAPLFVEDPVARFHRRLWHTVCHASARTPQHRAAACGVHGEASFATPALVTAPCHCTNGTPASANYTGQQVGSGGAWQQRCTCTPPASNAGGGVGDGRGGVCSNTEVKDEDTDVDSDDDDDDDAYGEFAVQALASTSPASPPPPRARTRCTCRCGSGGVGDASGDCHCCHEGGGDDRGGYTSASAPPLTQWRRIAIKFPTLRVHERWLTLLQSTTQTVQWADFLRHLPQLDVLNLLVARLFFENTRTSSLHDFMERKLQAKLANVSKTLPRHFRGNITLANLMLGGEIPLLTHFSEGTVTPTGDLEFDFDVLYRGGLVLSICFDIRYRRIRLPKVIFHVKVLELAGRMRFSIAPPPTTKFWLSGPKPPQLRLEFSQETVSREGVLSVLVSMIPDMSEFMTNVVKVLLFEDMVLPNYDDFPWPVLSESSSDEDVGKDDMDTATTTTTRTTRGRAHGDAHHPHRPTSPRGEHDADAAVDLAEAWASAATPSGVEDRPRREGAMSPATATATAQQAQSAAQQTTPTAQRQISTETCLGAPSEYASDGARDSRAARRTKCTRDSPPPSLPPPLPPPPPPPPPPQVLSTSSASSTASFGRVASLVRDSFDARPTMRIMAADTEAAVLADEPASAQRVGGRAGAHASLARNDGKPHNAQVAAARAAMTDTRMRFDGEPRHGTLVTVRALSIDNNGGSSSSSRSSGSRNGSSSCRSSCRDRRGRVDNDDDDDDDNNNNNNESSDDDMGGVGTGHILLEQHTAGQHQAAADACQGCVDRCDGEATRAATHLHKALHGEGAKGARGRTRVLQGHHGTNHAVDEQSTSKRHTRPMGVTNRTRQGQHDAQQVVAPHTTQHYTAASDINNNSSSRRSSTSTSKIGAGNAETATRSNEDDGHRDETGVRYDGGEQLQMSLHRALHAIVTRIHDGQDKGSNTATQSQRNNVSVDKALAVSGTRNDHGVHRDGDNERVHVTRTSKGDKPLQATQTRSRQDVNMTAASVRTTMPSYSAAKETEQQGANEGAPGGKNKHTETKGAINVLRKLLQRIHT